MAQQNKKIKNPGVCIVNIVTTENTQFEKANNIVVSTTQINPV